MRTSTITSSILLIAASAVCAACGGPGHSVAREPPIVGTWLVHDPNAPFPALLYVFNADGTMQQANPDAGDARASDSDGKGVWQAHGDRVDGKWVEVVADRVTHQYAGRLEITMQIAVHGDSLAASETARAFDANGQPAHAPATPMPLVGTRVTLP